MENCFPLLQNFTDSDSSTILVLLESLNEVITSSQDELDIFYDSGGLQLILNLLSSDNKFHYICLKILLNASKRKDKFREELVKTNIFDLLTIQLKQESDFSKRNLVLYAALIIVLVYGNEIAQDRIRTSGCLSHLVYILNTFLVDVEKKPLPLKNTELLVYSIIACNKDPRHFENQTEVGWITPKVVEYLGKQTIFSTSDEIQVMQCFWSFLKSVLHKNELNQQIFLKCSGFAVLFRSMQEIVDENKSNEFGILLIKMTGVLVRLKSQKKFLHLASSYCSLMILRNLLNTCNAWVIQHVITFLDCLTQEIPFVLQPARDKQILQCLVRAKIILSENKMSAALCQNIWERIVTYPKIFHDYNTFTSDRSSDNESHTSSGLNYYNNQFCNIHNPYIFEGFHEESKINETRNLNIWAVQLRNQVKERKSLKLGLINHNRGNKSITRITIRKIIQFFGNLQSSINLFFGF